MLHFKKTNPTRIASNAIALNFAEENEDPTVDGQLTLTEASTLVRS
jgi:hypothetical protein